MERPVMPLEVLLATGATRAEGAHKGLGGILGQGLLAAATARSGSRSRVLADFFVAAHDALVLVVSQGAFVNRYYHCVTRVVGRT
jgi:hypothetical protein